MGFKNCAEELPPAGLEDNVFRQDRPASSGTGIFPSEHSLDGRPDEKEERNQGARRIPRQAEDELAAENPEKDGLARLDTHLPENRPDTAGPELILDQVVITDRNAAGEDQDIDTLGPSQPGR